MRVAPDRRADPTRDSVSGSSSGWRAIASLATLRSSSGLTSGALRLDLAQRGRFVLGGDTAQELMFCIQLVQPEMLRRGFLRPPYLQTTGMSAQVLPPPRGGLRGNP
jgi:hypothetical protein